VDKMGPLEDICICKEGFIGVFFVTNRGDSIGHRGPLVEKHVRRAQLICDCLSYQLIIDYVTTVMAKMCVE
jgi:hypothetical protein